LQGIADDFSVRTLPKSLLMVDRNPARPLNLVQRVEQMCDFIENPAITTAVNQHVPVTMPRAPGAWGFDIPLSDGKPHLQAAQRRQPFAARPVDAPYRPTGSAAWSGPASGQIGSQESPN
jgi:hypothetical protein